MLIKEENQSNNLNLSKKNSISIRYYQNDEDAQMMGDFSLDQYSNSRPQYPGKKDRFKDSFIAPWGQESPRQFLQIMGKKQGQKLKEKKQLMVQNNSSRNLEQMNKSRSQLNLQTHERISNQPILSDQPIAKDQNTISQQFEIRREKITYPMNLVQSYMKNTLQTQNKFLMVSPRTPLKTVRMNQEKPKQVRQLRNLYENRSLQQKISELNHVIQVRQMPIENPQYNQSQPLLPPNSERNSQVPTSSFPSRAQSPRNIQTAYVQKQRTKISSALPDFRQRLETARANRAAEQNQTQLSFLPLELNGKKMENQNSGSQSLINTQRNIRKYTKGQINESLHASQDLMDKSHPPPIQQENFISKFSELCKKSGVELEKGQANYQVIKKTVDRYFNNRQNPNYLQTIQGFNNHQTEDFVYNIQKKREQEVLSLAINKVVGFNLEVNENRQKKFNVQKTISNAIKKQRSHVLLFKNGQHIDQKPLSEMNSAKTLMVDSKEFQMNSESQRVLLQQKDMRKDHNIRVKKIFNQTAQKNAKRKFNQIIEDLKDKLDVNGANYINIQSMNPMNFQLPQLNTTTQSGKPMSQSNFINYNQ